MGPPDESTANPSLSAPHPYMSATMCASPSRAHRRTHNADPLTWSSEVEASAAVSAASIANNHGFGRTYFKHYMMGFRLQLQPVSGSLPFRPRRVTQVITIQPPDYIVQICPTKNSLHMYSYLTSLLCTDAYWCIHTTCSYSLNHHTCIVRLLLLFYLLSDNYRLIHKKFTQNLTMLLMKLSDGK